MTAEKYRILRALNIKGTVTLAESRDDGGKYVLKELPAESAAVYRRISELSPHANLMRVHEIIQQDGRAAAVCGYAQGQPLSELIESGRVFSPDEVRGIITQLCRAAEHMHGCGIIHRDISPKNIILDEKLHLTLIDYDISRFYSGKRGQDTTLFGTEGFAPPEQYGFCETAFTADVYAVGMVMKLLLNACPVCPAAQEVLLRRIAAKCTRFVPDRRYGSARALRRAVSRSRWAVPAGIAAACTVSAAGIAAAVLLLHSAVAAPLPTDTRRNFSAAEAGTEAALPPANAHSEATAPIIVTTARTTAAAASVQQTTAAPVMPQTAAPLPQTTAEQSSAEISAMQKTTEPQSSSPAATTVATAVPDSAPTATVTPAAAEVPEVPQELLLQKLHTSDMDNPDKITVTTKLNERGFYEDYFDYVFYDDPAVHGEWSFCTYLPVEALNSALTADCIKSCNYTGETSPYSLTLGDNGEISAVRSDGAPMLWFTCWTNGYLIYESGDGAFAQRLFEIVADGEEFLFYAHKSGDFMRENKVYVYAVFTRAE